MAFKFMFLPDAEKQLRELDRLIAQRILRKLHWIERQTNPVRHATMLHKSKIGDIRFRIGDYRVIGIIDYKASLLAVVAVGHRRDIYS